MVFSIYISDEGEKSSFTAGGYDIDKFAPDGTLTWNPLVDDDYWRIDLDKAVIGDVKVLTSTDTAIIDSGTTFIAMPDYDLESLVQLLDSVYGIRCTESSSLHTCTCPDALNDQSELPEALKITLSGTNTYEVPLSEIIINDDFSFTGCSLAVMGLGNADFWILGDSFMRQYYSIFDMET